MKSLLNAITNCKINNIKKIKAVTFLFIVMLLAFLLSSCKKQNMESTAGNAVSAGNYQEASDASMLQSYKGINKNTLKQLADARVATAKYQNIENAFADGYADISVVMENMGYHFMKSDILDSNFEVGKPELLVYNKTADGQFVLVAVEYAAPLELLPDAPPSGFAGSADMWDRNITFGIWTLHAWIWKYNPDGVFAPMNPTVHVN